MRAVHAIKLRYDPEPRTQMLKESITFCASVELFLRGIESYQTSATTLEFDSARDRTLALLILSNSSSFHCVCIDSYDAL